MLTGIHFLLTYRCIFECDHCFLYCGPHAKGTFTLEQIRNAFDEMIKIGTIEWVYFEGGEPFLYYPVVLEGLRIGRRSGFKTGVVTNGYWATCYEDAKLWLDPLKDIKISELSVSDDAFHHGDEEENPARVASEAARRAGLSVETICIESPRVEGEENNGRDKGEPIVGGDVRFRGRAVEKLTEGLPKKRWESFDECPHEDLENPQRVHIDPFGNVHICQGLSIGNMEEKPLSVIVKDYEASKHPVCGPLVKGGPAQLAREYNIEHEEQYVDACHSCYRIRLALIEKFPQYLAPRLVYGLEEDKETSEEQ